MSEKYIYGNQTAEVSPAEEIQGTLIRSGNEYYFRVYEQNGGFIDYILAHDDLEVKISATSMASFYHFAEKYILDHSPQVLGLKKT